MRHLPALLLLAGLGMLALGKAHGLRTFTAHRVAGEVLQPCAVSESPPVEGRSPEGGAMAPVLICRFLAAGPVESIALQIQGPMGEVEAMYVAQGEKEIRFADLTPGEKRLAVMAEPGYLPVEEIVDLNATREVLISLSPGGRIAGHVTSPEGRPLLDYEVLARVPASFSESSLDVLTGWILLDGIVYRRTRTDASGYFLLDGIPWGEQEIIVQGYWRSEKFRLFPSSSCRLVMEDVEPAS